MYDLKHLPGGWAVFAALALFCVQPGQALCQQLPWQTDQQQQPQSQQPQHQHHHGGGNNAAAPHAARATQDSQRDRDDRELNTLANQFYHIGSKDKQAITKLKKLEATVKDYHASLTKANYDAGDIIKDTENLQRRIASQRKKLEAKAAAAKSKPPTPTAAVNPATTTPGATPDTQLPDSPARQ